MNARAEKLLRLLALVPGRRDELTDRLRAVADVQLERLWLRPPYYAPRAWAEVRSELDRLLGDGAAAHLDDPELREIEQATSSWLGANAVRGPFTQVHNGDRALAQACYVACRIARPQVVIETGVAYGVTTSFVLRALEANGGGILHSIDLPPLGADADAFVGGAVPDALRPRWRLHRGTSKRLLPALLGTLPEIGLFIHDSLHTYRNIRRELELVGPKLSRDAVVVCDDVEGNPAFAEWVAKAAPSRTVVVREADKASLFGVGRLGRS